VPAAAQPKIFLAVQINNQAEAQSQEFFIVTQPWAAPDFSRMEYPYE